MQTYIAYLSEPETKVAATMPQMQLVKKLWHELRRVHAATLSHTTNFHPEQLAALVQTVNPAVNLGGRSLQISPELAAFQTALNQAILERFVGELTAEAFQNLDKSAASYLITALKKDFGAILADGLTHFDFEEQVNRSAGLVTFPRFDLDLPANAELRALVLEIARSMFGTPEPETTPETGAAQNEEVASPESTDSGEAAPIGGEAAPAQMMEVFVPFHAAGNRPQAHLYVQRFRVDMSKLSATGRVIADKLANRQRGYSVRETYNPRREWEEKLRAYSPEQRPDAERVYGPSYPDTQRTRTRSVLFPFPPCINAETDAGRSYGERGLIAPGFDIYVYIEAHAQNRTPDQISRYRP